MLAKQIKEKLKNGQGVFGAWIQECPWPGLIQIYAQTGVDCVFLCAEHSSLTSESMSRMIQVGRMTNTAVIVRVEDCAKQFISKSLDWGANGIMVPMVETPETVRRILKLAKYAPIGERGMSTSTGHRDYCSNEPIGAYQARANAENITLVQIETAAAVENIDSLASFDEIDVVFIGPVDLSCSLNIPGQLDHPLLHQTIEKIMQAAQKHNKAVGVAVGSMAAARTMYKKGIRLITWSNELRIIAQGATAAVAEFKTIMQG